MSTFDLIEELFTEALTLPAQDRFPWLDQRCPDAAVRTEVAGLLRAHDRMSRVDSMPGPGRMNAIPAGRFGAYRAVRLLGRGGMSSVYLAERADGQFQQQVALKLMGAHLGTPEFQRRFQTEQQLLASLNHPNVTRLLDGGVSESGDPYLVVEYVDGQPLDLYCDGKRLPVEARLRLFLNVCEAVEYAHQNLVVHRDLKPANILVTAEGVVKLLDFGTASLVAQSPEVTSTGVRMLTPRYASPEQLRGERVTTSTDVFALGVILYELLTGAWPFGRPDSLLCELNRALGEVGPQSPVSVITAEAAALRAVPLPELRRRLVGDLSAIAAKALENDPANRYESVRRCADDVFRYLDGRTIHARPQTALYRTGKFLRKHRIAVSASAIFVAGLLVATGVAIQAARDARAQAQKSAQVNLFLTDMLSSASVVTFDPQKYTVAQMLTAAESQVERGWGGDRAVEAAVRRSLGASLSAIFELDRGRVQLERSLAIFRALGDPLEECSSLELMGELEMNAGHYDDSAANLELGLEVAKRAKIPARLAFDLRYYLSYALFMANRRPDEVKRLCEEAINIASRDISIPPSVLAGAQAHLGAIAMKAGDLIGAERLLRVAMETGAREQPGGWWEQYPLYQLMVLSARKEDPAAALEAARRRYDVFVKHAGVDAAGTLAAKILWLRFRAEMGETDEAVKEYRTLLPRVRGSLPQGSFNLWNQLASGSVIYFAAGKFADSEKYARESLAVADGNHIPTVDPRRAESLVLLGKALCASGRTPQGWTYLAEAATVYDQLGLSWKPAGDRARSLIDFYH